MNENPEELDPQTQQAIQLMAREIAAHKEFEDRCNRIHKQGTETHQDFDGFIDAIGNGGGLSPLVVDAIVSSDDAVPLIAYLGQNPDVVATIKRLPAHLQIAEIVRLERSIGNVAAAVTKAPEPIVPLTGLAVADSDPSDSDDVKAWVKKRKNQIRKK